MPSHNAITVQPTISAAHVMETSLSHRIPSHALPATFLIVWGAPTTTSVSNVLQDFRLTIMEEEAVVISVMSRTVSPAWEPTSAQSVISDSS